MDSSMDESSLFVTNLQHNWTVKLMLYGMDNTRTDISLVIE